MKRTRNTLLIACLASAILLVGAVPAWAAPGNDNLAAATAIAAVPATESGDTTGASLEPGEPQPCGSIGSTVWYTVTPSQDGTIIFDTFGSTYDTVLAVHQGTSMGSLVLRACNDDSTGLQSKVTVPVSAGVTYSIQVGGFVGQTGPLTLNLAAFVPVAGDSFSSPHVFGDLPYSFSGATTQATDESAEPHPCGGIGSTLWFRYDATEPGLVSVTTAGSGYDSVLAVYSGSSLGSLALIDCNDDAGVYPFHAQSMVGFTATPGTSYYIQAGGYAGSRGPLELRASFGAHAGDPLGAASVGFQADDQYQEVDVVAGAVVVAGASVRVDGGSVEEALVCAVVVCV